MNGHFYHIEVIDLPFHTIPFVSCFISLIDNTKKWTFIENFQANLGSSLCFKVYWAVYFFAFFFALRTTLALMRSYVRSQELCAWTMTMEDTYLYIIFMIISILSSQDYASIARTQCWFWFYCTARGTLLDTHRIHVYYVNGCVTHGKPWNSWGNYFMIMK